jgi:Winged helix DNA-binding domain
VPVDPRSADGRLSIARWRLANQHLAGLGLAEPIAVVRHLLAVQAENHSQASWAVATRTVAPDAALFGHLYDDGHLLRTHVLRPTWHFVLPDDIGWLLDLSRPRLTRSWERQLEQEHIDQQDWEHAVTLITETLPGRTLTRSELADHLAASGVTMSGHALMLVCGLTELHGLICSGPARDGQHTYALLSERVPFARHLDADHARAELVVRYIGGHGPVTERDIAYWATMTLGEVRTGIADNADRLASFQLDGKTFWHTPGAPPAGPIKPQAHLLQILDEYYRGYQDSRDLLAIDGHHVTGRESAAGMVIVDSQLVGHMKRTITPDYVTFDIHLLRTLTAQEHTAIQDAADRYGRYLNRHPQLRFA